MFHKVVWQHMQGVVGFFNNALLQIYLEIFQWKNWNRLRFDRIMAMDLWPHFWVHHVYSHASHTSTADTYKLIRLRVLMEIGPKRWVWLLCDALLARHLLSSCVSPSQVVVLSTGMCTRPFRPRPRRDWDRDVTSCRDVAETFGEKQ